MLNANSGSKRKLNLINVTELIGESYEDWLEGDFVIIESQTGTGKTYFTEMTLIKNLRVDSILFVCNRKNLERQIKRDILKIKNQEIPSSVEELDQIKKIGNVTITTYQALQSSILNDEYFKTPFERDYSSHDCIILDECHYILSDSDFNNTTRLVFDKFLRSQDWNAIKVFMTATTIEIKGPILSYVEYLKPKAIRTPYTSGGLRVSFEPKVYSSGIDYSYLKPIYFNDKSLIDIVTTIQNDTSDDKWIIFVSNIEKQGQLIYEKLGSKAIFITKHTSSDDPELVSIINDSRFNKKVLITTKTLDNGINIKDEKVKNIVILAWNMITFVQMLGRRRIDIDNANNVNLYIPLRDIRSFYRWARVYNSKLEVANLCEEDHTAFSRKYDTDFKTLPNIEDIIYRDRISGKWAVNKIGKWRVLTDLEHAKSVIHKFKREGRFAFIKEQLSWIGLEHTFDESNLVENVIPKEITKSIEDYLCGLYENKTVMLMNEDRQGLILKMNIRNADNKVLKSIDTLNSALEEMCSDYRIKAFETSRTIDKQKKNYKNAWRIDKR